METYAGTPVRKHPPAATTYGGETGFLVWVAAANYPLAFELAAGKQG